MTMKKIIMIAMVISLLTAFIENDKRYQDDEIRRPFIPGREQNIF